jgi:hypothetical protein
MLNEHNKGASVVKHGRIDMDHDGDKEYVLFIRAYFADRDICSGRLSNLLVLKDDKYRMDKRYKYLTTMAYDLFYYDGLPRLSKWENDSFGVNDRYDYSLPSLWIYDFGIGKVDVCIFQYYQNTGITK